MGRFKRLFGRGTDDEVQREKPEMAGSGMTAHDADNGSTPPASAEPPTEDSARQATTDDAGLASNSHDAASSPEIEPKRQSGNATPGAVDTAGAPEPIAQTDGKALEESEGDGGPTINDDEANAQAIEPAEEAGIAVPEPVTSESSETPSAVQAESSPAQNVGGGETPRVLEVAAPADVTVPAPSAIEPDVIDDKAAESPAGLDELVASSPAIGTTIAGRYTIVRALTPESAADLVGDPVPVGAAEYYAVDDRNGYERCWSCGSTSNDKSKRFCIDCGAPQQRESILARTETATGEADEFAEAGSFYHVLHRRKQFGSTGIALEVGAFSAEGPHHPNEDSYWAGVVGGCFDSRSEMIGVFVLADGMGGYAPGSGLISKSIVTTVGQGIFSLLTAEISAERGDDELRAVVHGAIADANGKVLDEIHVHGDMGATLVVAVIFKQTAYLANIGDSRAYYVSSSGTVAQITRDQSFVEQQVALGRLSPDAVFTALGNNVILHAVGEEAVENTFDWYTQPLEPGSHLMLCSDGYWKTMQHMVWDAEAAATEPTLRALARTLVENALANNTDDNTTVLLVGID